MRRALTVAAGIVATLVSAPGQPSPFKKPRRLRQPDAMQVAPDNRGPRLQPARSGAGPAQPARKAVASCSASALLPKLDFGLELLYSDQPLALQQITNVPEGALPDDKRRHRARQGQAPLLVSLESAPVSQFPLLPRHHDIRGRHDRAPPRRRRPCPDRDGRRLRAARPDRGGAWRLAADVRVARRRAVRRHHRRAAGPARRGDQSSAALERRAARPDRRLSHLCRGPGLCLGPERPAAGAVQACRPASPSCCPACSTWPT